MIIEKILPEQTIGFAATIATQARYFDLYGMAPVGYCTISDKAESLAGLRAIRLGLPAILCSGYDESQAMSGNYAERPQAFSLKPFEINELNTVLRSLLGKPNKEIIDPMKLRAQHMGTR